jgi:3-oxoacyl-[acyl-carrier protein] reductase
MSPRVALVTGAASGIGLATARALAMAGLQLLLVDRSPSVREAAANLVADGHSAHGWVADLSDSVQVLEAADWAHQVAGGCDVLVNNAGIHPKTNGRITPLEDMPLQEWDEVLRVNLTAPFLLAQRILPGMRARRWGRVVNVASRAARTYSERAGTHYVASKAGLIGLTRKIAGDYAAHGITANCVAPGQIATAMASRSSSEVLAAAARDALVGRVGSATEVAETIRFLASQEAAYITGAVVDVNGGAFIG